MHWNFAHWIFKGDLQILQMEVHNSRSWRLNWCYSGRRRSYSSRANFPPWSSQNNSPCFHQRKNLSFVYIREASIKKIYGIILEFFPTWGGGLPNSQNFCYFTIALKKPLKHLKITQKFPTWPKNYCEKWSKFPKGGVGGDPTFGKNSQIIPYFFLRPSLTNVDKNI